MRHIMGVCFVLAAAGCGGGPSVQTVDVSGVVYLDGQPVEGVEVDFLGENFAGFAKTDSQGRYQLVQGAQPGLNKVCFSKWEGGSTPLLAEAGIDAYQLQLAAEASGGRVPHAPRQIIPPQYSNPADTKIEFHVPKSGASTADFRLTSK